MNDPSSPESDWSALAPHVKRRKCPGCGEELSRFHLTAALMPIEQFTIPGLREANARINWSLRPFASQNVNELQLVCFMSPCNSCTLISFWDFGNEELDEILSRPVSPPFAQIAWNYDPNLIEERMEAAPEWLKPHLERLLTILRSRPSDGAR